MKTYTLHFDGSCWPNPGGTAAIGYILKLHNNIISQGHKVIGTGPEMSNNAAEHAAVAAGLHELTRLNPRNATLVIYGDSQLIINHINRTWQGHESKLYYGYYKQTMLLISQLEGMGIDITALWIPREQNTECDNLSKIHLEYAKLA